jgi:hypothetical protein
MKKYFIIIIAFFFIKNNYAQSLKKLAGDTIVWSANYQLQQADFKSKPRGKGAGATVSGIYFHAKEVSGEVIFVVENFFVKSKSFLREESAYVLKHEQVHFDIGEVHARKFRQRLSLKDFSKVKDIMTEVRKIYDRTVAESNREQNTYDDFTEHGRNPARQKIWNEKVAAELKELDAYSSTDVNITK